MNSFLLFSKHVVTFLVLSGHSVPSADVFISFFPVFSVNKCTLCAYLVSGTELGSAPRLWLWLLGRVRWLGHPAWLIYRGLREGRMPSRSQHHTDSDGDSNAIIHQARPPPDNASLLSGAGVVNPDPKGTPELRNALVISHSESEATLKAGLGRSSSLSPFFLLDLGLAWTEKEPISQS